MVIISSCDTQTKLIIGCQVLQENSSLKLLCLTSTLSYLCDGGERGMGFPESGIGRFLILCSANSQILNIENRNTI